MSMCFQTLERIEIVARDSYAYVINDLYLGVLVLALRDWP